MLLDKKSKVFEGIERELELTKSYDAAEYLQEQTHRCRTKEQQAMRDQIFKRLNMEHMKAKIDGCRD
jgi:hypothetical protein